MRLLCGVGVGAWNGKEVWPDGAQLPLAALGNGLVVWPCRHSGFAHAEEAGELGVVGESEGFSYCALGHVHARESIAMNFDESTCLNLPAGKVQR
jgi:hypothetical protein